MSRPKIKIHREPFDRIVEAVGMAAVIVLISLPLTYYHELPEMIPSHFNGGGEPDDYNSKVIIWLLPAVGLFMYAGLAILNHYPHIFNYLTKINEQNARMQYKLATRMIRILNTVLACVFCYLTYVMIQTGLGNQSGLGKYFLPVTMMVFFGPVAWYFYRAVRAR